MANGELELVEWLRGWQRRHPAVRLGIGDDMACVEATSRTLLVSSDMLLDGVHFDTAEHPYAKIGRKAICCSLSDCAAMAVKPLAATVSLALPTSIEMSDAQAMFGGMGDVADEYDLAIVGGDTTRWNHPLAIDVAITATPFEGIDPILRSGAKIGDRLYVTGTLGGSLLGHHLNFTPRVREARLLAQTLGHRLHAMMDISDGLALDLWRLCEASGVGARLEEPLLEAVVSDDARRLASTDGKIALDHALSDGEDFELLLAIDGDISGLTVPLHSIGEVTADNLQLRRRNGEVELLAPKGFVH